MIQITEWIWESLRGCEGFLIIIKLHEQRTNVISSSWRLGISPIHDPAYIARELAIYWWNTLFVHIVTEGKSTLLVTDDWYISNFFCLLIFSAFQKLVCIKYHSHNSTASLWWYLPNINVIQLVSWILSPGFIATGFFKIPWHFPDISLTVFIFPWQNVTRKV